LLEHHSHVLKFSQWLVFWFFGFSNTEPIRILLDPSLASGLPVAMLVPQLTLLIPMHASWVAGRRRPTYDYYFLVSQAVLTHFLFCATTATQRIQRLIGGKRLTPEPLCQSRPPHNNRLHEVSWIFFNPFHIPIKTQNAG